MNGLQRVVWTEGMLVSPHHLQQMDAYHERLLHARVGAVAPLPWGIAELEIDAAALRAGQVRLTKFRGVLPEGLLLDFKGQDPEAPPARALDGVMAPTMARLEVYLGVPKEREGVPSLADDAPAPAPRPGAPRAVPRTRFRTTVRNVHDASGAAAAEPVQFGERNVVLLLGNEPRDDFETIKIGEIVRDAAGAYDLNEAFVPPVVRVGASTFLVEGVRRILALVVARQRSLADERRQRDASSVEFAAGDITKYLQLSTLNGVLPVLKHVASLGDSSPVDLYLTLCQVAGQMATFSAEVDPAELPAFQFNDLGATFEELFAIVTSLLRATAMRAFLPIPLEVNQGVVVGRMADDKVISCRTFVLAVRTEMAEGDVAQRLPVLCKIASPGQLPYILRAATPGVPLQVTHRPPQEIPVKPGIVYFTLNLQSDHWRPVVDERAIAMYLPPPFDPTRAKLELYGIPKPA